MDQSGPLADLPLGPGAELAKAALVMRSAAVVKRIRISISFRRDERTLERGIPS
jgi:hypothetical protein